MYTICFFFLKALLFFFFLKAMFFFFLIPALVLYNVLWFIWYRCWRKLIARWYCSILLLLLDISDLLISFLFFVDLRNFSLFSCIHFLEDFSLHTKLSIQVLTQDFLYKVSWILCTGSWFSTTMVTASQLQIFESPITSLISIVSTSVTVKLDDSNYLAWHFQLQLLLEGHRILWFVDGSTLCPSKFALVVLSGSDVISGGSTP